MIQDQTSQSHPPRALIIGGGIGGLAAAIALRKIGWAVEIYERVPELHEVGAGLSLWANAIKALAYLGVAEAVRAQALPETTGGIRTPSGDLLMLMTNRQLAERFGELSIMVHRAELHDLLRREVAADLHLGMACTGIEEDGEGVRARFANGHMAFGDLLIGADGIHSQVRTYLHGAQPPTYAGYTAWRAVIPFGHARLQPGETWGQGARFGQIAMQGGRVYWFAAANAPEGVNAPQGEKAALQELFGNWHAPIPALIAATPPAAILRNDIYDRPPLTHWGRGRVTLLGDAAHPMTPNLGQGACQALEDAVVLAKQLADRPDIPAALAAYEAARIPRTTMIVQQSRRVGAVAQWDQPALVALRNFLAKHLLSRLTARQLAPVIGYEV